MSTLEVSIEVALTASLYPVWYIAAKEYWSFDWISYGVVSTGYFVFNLVIWMSVNSFS